MALSSTSTNAQVKAAYEDNASYDINNSVAECRDFIQAARIRINRMANEIENGNARVSESYQRIEAQLKEALRWLRVNDPSASSAAHGGSVSHISFEDFRG